jgi:hypothetical protein
MDSVPSDNPIPLSTFKNPVELNMVPQTESRAKFSVVFTMNKDDEKRVQEWVKKHLVDELKGKEIVRFGSQISDPDPGCIYGLTHQRYCPHSSVVHRSGGMLVVFSASRRSAHVLCSYYCFLNKKSDAQCSNWQSKSIPIPSELQKILFPMLPPVEWPDSSKKELDPKDPTPISPSFPSARLRPKPSVPFVDLTSKKFARTK